MAVAHLQDTGRSGGPPQPCLSLELWSRGGCNPPGIGGRLARTAHSHDDPAVTMDYDHTAQSASTSQDADATDVNVPVCAGKVAPTCGVAVEANSHINLLLSSSQSSSQPQCYEDK